MTLWNLTLWYGVSLSLCAYCLSRNMVYLRNLLLRLTKFRWNQTKSEPITPANTLEGKRGEGGRERGEEIDDMATRAILYKHTHTQHSPDKSKRHKLLQIKGEIWSKRSPKKSCDCLLILEPYSCQTEEKCTTHCSKEPSPVVPHSKVCCSYFNAKKHT